jgi:hypothetical protein
MVKCTRAETRRGKTGRNAVLKVGRRIVQKRAKWHQLRSELRLLLLFFFLIVIVVKEREDDI